MLRWVRFAGIGMWHLRFGTDGPAECGAEPSGLLARSRRLATGAPASPCNRCQMVVAQKVGIVR